MEKKVWQEPAMEVLDVNMTMIGTGTNNFDWAWVDGKPDFDITDGPGVPVKPGTLPPIS